MIELAAAIYLMIGLYFMRSLAVTVRFSSYVSWYAATVLMLCFWPVILGWGYLEANYMDDQE